MQSRPAVATNGNPWTHVSENDGKSGIPSEVCGELENIIEAVPEGEESSISRTQVTYKRLRNIGTDEVSLYPSAKRNRRGEPQRSSSGITEPVNREVQVSSLPVLEDAKQLEIASNGLIPSTGSTGATSLDGSNIDESDNEEERQLLSHVRLDDRDSRDHELRTAPVMTREAYAAAGGRSSLPQRGLLGSVVEIYGKDGPCTADSCRDERLYLNTNAPFSALVCGVQGSGKSHTVSVILENMFMPSCPNIGSVVKPLCGLVLHFGEGGPYAQPCEAAWISRPAAGSAVETPPVRVFVSKSSLKTMQEVYAQLGSAVTVEPLLFNQEELDAQAFLSMMAVGQSDNIPLYMQTVLSILRDLGEDYSYQAFRNELQERKKKFNPAQLAGVEQRTALLEAFLDKRPLGEQRAAPVRFAAGQLTIIDLSDPFIDPTSACGLFEIITRLFVRSKVDTGKVLVVDEAHKYLSPNRTTSGLTKELLSLIRQQRHQAMRIVISTQEPTVVPPVLLDLCSVTLLHRFSSPAWWEHVAKHVSADIESKEAFDKVVNLQTGQAILLAPTGLGMSTDLSVKPVPGSATRTLRHFGRKCVLIKTRLRITMDGGASVLVVPT